MSPSIRPTTVFLMIVASITCPASGQDKRQLRPIGQAAPATDQGRQWAVVIGVNEYIDPAIPALKYCVADAQLMAKQLTERCGYDDQRVLLITDNQPRAHLRPIKRNLQVQVPDWLKRAQKGDTVIVFFSGHGFLDDRGQGFLAPQDCELANLGLSALRTDELRDMLRQCKATQKLLVLDCCHAGGEKGAGPVGSSSHELGKVFGLAEGLVTLASCRKQETSREWEAKGHGLFTYYLAEGLTGKADADQNGVVDSDELYNYVLESVQLSGQRELNARQTPVRIIGEDVVGRFALAWLGRINGGSPASATAPSKMIPLEEAIRQILAVQVNPAVRDCINVGLVLSSSVTFSDLQAMSQSLKNKNAVVTCIVADDKQAKLIQGTVAAAGGRCTVETDIRRMLDNKEVDVMVLAGLLKEANIQDVVLRASSVASVDGVDRYLIWSFQAGKDAYVASFPGDLARWKPDRRRHCPLIGGSESNVVEAAMKYNRVASAGGLAWSDFEDFLSCVMSRAEPRFSVKRATAD
jgi:uncharacterized caspase-like protein